MDNASRFPKADTKRRLTELAARPVLARLPDVSADLLRQRPVKQSGAGRAGYRFDPPQASERGSQTADTEQATQVPNLKSELIYAPQASRPHQPHVFERGRTAESQARLSRRQSAILPRSNPFAIPRRPMIDSITPVLRFLTLVALFTAAATWIQIVRLGNKPASKSAEPRTTTAQERPARAGKTGDRPVQAPTAIGPVGTTPESGTRVGRVRENDDFATLRGDIVPVTPFAGEAGVAAPDLVGANGSALPRVQTAEAPGAGVGDDPARVNGTGRPPEVASLPGFIIEIPSR